MELTVSTAARIATFGCVEAERDCKVDRVLTDVDLVFERRCDVDGRVGDDQHLVVGRHVHDEHVTDAAARPQSGVARHHGAEQLVGVQAALHQQFGFAEPHEFNRLRGRRVAVRRIDDARLAEIDPMPLSDVADLRRRTDEDRR